MYKKAIPLASIAIASVLFSVSSEASAALTAPTRTMKMGDSGQDVLLLQRILNTSTDTTVSLTGAGSPGLETTYYGKKTYDAVKKLQLKYAVEILYPLGLIEATGVVGQATLRKITQVASEARTTTAQSAAPIPSTVPVQTTPIQAPTPPPTPLQTPTIPTTSLLSSTTPSNAATLKYVALPGVPKPVPLNRDMQIPPGVNPNTINLEYALAVIEYEGKKEGMSQSQIETVKAAIKANAESSAPYRTQFFDSIKPSLQAPQLPSAWKPVSDSPLYKVLSFFGLINIAQAAGVPFGGAIFFVTPCTCTAGAAWLLLIEPLPPTFPTTLTYITGTQLFLSYNLPFSTHLLGFYAPGVQSCFVGVPPACAPTPTWGLIEPIVGSAPI